MNLKFDKNRLDYNIIADIILFWTSGIDESKEATILFNDFLLKTSKDREVFFHAYRLPDVCEIIDDTVIVAKEGIFQDPFNTFFHLQEAKVKSNSLDYACEASFYYFEKSVSWADFLAFSSQIKTKELIKEGLLFARFSSLDHGADFWFESSIKYESEVMKLFDELSKLGWEIKQTNQLKAPWE